MTADETAHVDYAVSVWHGKLPVFEHGLDFRPEPPARVPPVQWASQHPPLFYVLLAPVVGPLADSGDWVAATLAGRSVTIVLGILLVLSVAWVAKAVFEGDRRRVLTALLVTVPMSAPLFVSSAVYNDVLAAVFVALTVGVSARAILHGVTWLRVGQLALLLSLGMLTRAMFITTAAAALLALAMSVLLLDPRPLRERLLRLAVAVPCISGAVLLSSGWFYARNVRLSGSWTGGRPDWAMEHLGRSRYSIAEALANSDLRNGYTRVFFDSGRGVALVATAVVILGTAVLGASALVAGGPRAAIPARTRRTTLVLVAYLVVQVLLTVGMQVVYISGGGGANFRYSLAALAPVVLLLTWSLTAWPKLGSVPVLLYAAVGTALLAVGIGKRGVWTGATLQNGPSYWWFVGCVVVACACIVAGAASFALLSHGEHTERGGSAEGADPATRPVGRPPVDPVSDPVRHVEGDAMVGRGRGGRPVRSFSHEDLHAQG